MRRIGLVLGLLVAACPPVGPKGQGLRVAITLDGGALSKCIKLEVTGADLINSATVVVDQPTFTIAVLKGSLPTEVALQAVGFSDTGCTTPTVPAEASERLSTSFPSDGVRDVSVTVRATSAVDADDDGASASVDCDDNEPKRAPGLPELCADRLDNDCNALVDCADSACANLACAAGASVAQASCFAGQCTERACDNGADDDGDTRTDCADTDCDTKLCANGGHCTSGACTNASTEAGLCRDGEDNDGDGLIDCLDPECLGNQCNDQLACSQAEVCQADKTCGSGTSVMCAAPSACFGNGTCLERPDGGGGCEYTVLTGNSCSDSKACTTGDSCGLDGGCVGMPVVCDLPPSPCFAAAGSCDETLDGGCVYAVVAGTCDDGRACSTTDMCAADGGCTGTEVVCVPNECQSNGVCSEATGGCTFTPKTGEACSVGVCSAQGECVPVIDGGTDGGGGSIDAGFIPSNFDPSQLPPTSVNAVFTCNATLTVNDNSVNLRGDSNGCAVPTIPSVTLTRPSPPNVVLMAMSSLTINPNVTLRVVGSRPVIFAVLNDATINGSLNASAVDSSSSGPGGNHDSFCSGFRGTAGSSAGTPGGGGGGGAFGSAGSNGGSGKGQTNNGTGAGVNGEDTLIPLRGGCAGANGGGWFAGAQGRAGGAVQLSAFGTLTVNGRVYASGTPGRGSFGFSSGGGGGGSGGGIVLEALHVQLGASSRVTANGGGGGAGGTTRSGAAGETGTQSATPAAGGAPPECGGAGGQGAAQLGESAVGALGGVGSTCTGNVGGGGGGGGGMGRIRVNAALGCIIASEAVISPSSSSAQPSCRH